MTRHLFKLVWNRKRTNVLIILEIFFSFLVVFAGVDAGRSTSGTTTSCPWAFRYQNVWQRPHRHERRSDEQQTRAGVERRFTRLLEETSRSTPSSRRPAPTVSPYEFGAVPERQDDRRPATCDRSWTRSTTGFADVLGLQARRRPLVPGRPTRRSDWRPVVIDHDLARDAFHGDERSASGSRSRSARFERPTRSRGSSAWCDDFRKGGELSGAEQLPVPPSRLGPSGGPAGADHPGARPARHARRVRGDLMRRLQGVAPEWSFAVKPLDPAARESTFRGC